MLYNLAVRLSYRGRYRARYSSVSELIPEGVRIVDYCCGDAEIYNAYLKNRDVDYLGLDFNSRFIPALQKKGVPCKYFNLLTDSSIDADYSLMMASLYQFIPEHGKIVDKILPSTSLLIISEPVKNLAQSQSSLARKLANWLNNPGDGQKKYRFTSRSFKEFIQKYEDRVVEYVQGEIEDIVVLRGDRA